MVRSRIEAMIADLYTQKGLTFEYEPILYFEDGSMVHPDFKVFCGRGNKAIYHEHFGLLSDPDYLRSYIWKVEHYIKEGYYHFYDVLFTYEKEGQGIDMTEMSMLIDMVMT